MRKAGRPGFSSAAARADGGGIADQHRLEGAAHFQPFHSIGHRTWVRS
jgi:hypothetical protein